MLALRPTDGRTLGGLEQHERRIGLDEAGHSRMSVPAIGGADRLPQLSRHLPRPRLTAAQLGM